MALYRYAGLSLASEVELEELETVCPDTGHADLTLSCSNTGAMQVTSAFPVPEGPSEPGACGFRTARTADGYWIRQDGLADFRISRDGCHVHSMASCDVELEALRHAILDQVLPRVVSYRGAWVLHAGAVLLGDSAAAFMGETGRGKSTLVESFRTHGHPVLTDDALLIARGAAGVLARPTYPSIRLWAEFAQALQEPDMLGDPAARRWHKSRIRLDAADHPGRDEPVPLSAIFLLQPAAADADPRVRVERLTHREACMQLIGNSFRLDLDDQDETARRFREACDFAERVPIFALSYRRVFADLSAVRDAILTWHRHAIETSHATRDRESAP